MDICVQGKQKKNFVFVYYKIYFRFIILQLKELWVRTKRITFVKNVEFINYVHCTFLIQSYPKQIGCVRKLVSCIFYVTVIRF